MGWFLIGVVLLSGAAKGFCGKKSSYAIETASDSMAINVLRMTLCILFGLVLALVEGGAGSLVPNGATLATAFSFGLFSSLFVIGWLLSVRSGAYMMVEVFLFLGSTLPVLLSALFLGRGVRWYELLGIGILLCAVYLMSAYQKTVKGKLTPRALGLLLLAGGASGLSDFSQKLFRVYAPEAGNALFQLYGYLFAAGFLLLVCLFLRRRERAAGAVLQSPRILFRRIFWYILVMAVCLFLHSYAKTAANDYFAPAELYPMTQGGAVLLSLLMSALFFRERVNLRCIVGISLAMLGLFFLNLFGMLTA